MKNFRFNLYLILFLACVFLGTARPEFAQTRQSFVRTEAMIPMRDGIRLHTVILVPENQSEKLPVLLNRTPYGVSGQNSDSVNARYAEFIRDGYIFVFQDIRGRYGSEGEFLMNRPLRTQPDAVDESTDTYDTIDWLVRNLPKNNGRVGIWGISYGGWLAAVALVNPHPALRASSPQAPMVDTWLGDDFFHNGAFRQTYGYEYVKSMETNKEGVDVSFGGEDAFDWYLKRKTHASFTGEFAGRMPSWNAFLKHPAYDEFWQTRASQLYVKRATVPTMIVGGWWDQEDLFGPLALYQALEKRDARNLVSLVMGPWNHGGWAAGRRQLENVDFGGDQSKYYREKIEAPWFAYYLKDKGKLAHAEATVFQSGSNRWQTYDAWSPRKNVERRNLYLQANGELSFEKPRKNDRPFDSYVSYPADPVPYRQRPIQAIYDYGKGSKWYTWLTLDQSFLADRKDVLSWKTEILTKDLTLTGDMIAHLFASTTGTDSDWIVKLVDVQPNGYQLMVAEEIFRGRYRTSFRKPAPIEPNKVNQYTIDLRGNNYTFLAGHRLMVQIQSSWFPLYDRNPQKFVENIFLATESDYQAATQRIYRAPEYPSHIAVFVAK